MACGLLRSVNGSYSMLLFSTSFVWDLKVFFLSSFERITVNIVVGPKVSRKIEKKYSFLVITLFWNPFDIEPTNYPVIATTNKEIRRQ